MQRLTTILIGLFLLAVAVVPLHASVLLTSPQPVENATIRPGLQPYYLYDFYRHINEMPEISQAMARGKAGAPVPLLDHKGGKTDPVFGSGKARGVGIIFQGLIRFDRPGRFRLQALSNDGVELRINGQPVFLDPDVHGDRLSPVGQVTVQDPGWYPLTIRYFQRKGTSALKLFWQPPAEESFTLVPASAFGHLTP